MTTTKDCLKDLEILVGDHAITVEKLYVSFMGCYESPVPNETSYSSNKWKLNLLAC